jgi:hypothetical protein
VEDYSNKTRNECVEALRHRRADVRASKRSAKVAIIDADPQERLDQLTMALASQQEVVAIRERQMQLDREERDALSIELQKATLEAEEARAKT